MKQNKSTLHFARIKFFFKRCFFCLLVGLILFYLLPFFTLCLGDKYRTAWFRHLSYTGVYRGQVSKMDSDSLRVMNCFDFVCKNVVAQQSYEEVQDLSPLDVLISGVGFCDQQANLLITLVEKGGFEANLIFLFGSDSISRHSVCEIRVGGSYVMFDPFYNLFFVNNENNLASISNIQNAEIRVFENQIIPENYFSFFAKEYPYKIYKRNKTKGVYRLFNQILNAWHFLFGNWAIEPYLFVYSKLDK